MTIENFYSGFIDLSSEYLSIVHAKVPLAVLAAFQVVHAKSQPDQILIKLQPKFEPIQAGLLSVI